MDARDAEDESKTRRREEMLARRMGEALDYLRATDPAGCPDAEIIAAYAEHGLEPAESARWEGHFADCARCRKILLVLSASADTPLAQKEVAQLGKLVSGVRAPANMPSEPVAVQPRGVADWRRRWLALAIGMAAVLIVWFAMRPPWRATDRGASATLVAQVPKEELPPGPVPAATDELSRVAPQQDHKTAATPEPGSSPRNGRSVNLPAQAPGLTKDRNVAGGSPQKLAPGSGGSIQENKKLDSLSGGLQIQPPEVPPTPPMPSRAQAATAAPGAPPAEAKAALPMTAASTARSESDANAVANAPPRDKQAAASQQAASALAVPSPSPQAAARARNIQGFAALKAAEPAFVQATAPFGSTVWRLGKAGKIEQSVDGGETWAQQTSPILQDWLAGVAVSDTVCWAAGRNGAIARTIDGEHWESIAPPARAAGTDGKLPDWTAITARDAQSGTITAGDGRRFATQDGGKTWQPL